MSNFNGTIVAFVVQAPEEKTSGKGTTYYRARVGIKKFERGEDVTYWANVTAFDVAPIRTLQNARVGSNLLIQGDLSISVYKNNKDEWVPSIDVVANMITFLPSARKDDDAPTTARTPVAAGRNADFDTSDDIPF